MISCLWENYRTQQLAFVIARSLLHFKIYPQAREYFQVLYKQRHTWGQKRTLDVNHLFLNKFQMLPKFSPLLATWHMEGNNSLAISPQIICFIKCFQLFFILKYSFVLFFYNTIFCFFPVTLFTLRTDFRFIMFLTSEDTFEIRLKTEICTAYFII